MIVNVFGEDLDVIDRVAANVGQAIGKVEGVVDLRVQRAANTPAQRHFGPRRALRPTA
jgi:Cu/Ag efflux pump CusA